MFPWDKVDGLWATMSEGVVLIDRAISFQDFQPMWSWSTNVTDRQTDGQHAISIPRYALVHRAVIGIGNITQKKNDNVCWRCTIKSCKARVETENGTVVKDFGLHTHMDKVSNLSTVALAYELLANGKHPKTYHTVRLRSSTLLCKLHSRVDDLRRTVWYVYCAIGYRTISRPGYFARCCKLVSRLHLCTSTSLRWPFMAFPTSFTCCLVLSTISPVVTTDDCMALSLL